MASPDFAALAQQYDPNSAMYKFWAGLAANPSAAQNSNVAAEIQNNQNGAPLPTVIQQGADGQPSGQVAYNAPTVPGASYTTTAPGAPGIAAPKGSTLSAASVIPQTPLVNAATLNPGAASSGTPDQTQSPNPNAQPGSTGGPIADTGIVGPTPTQSQISSWLQGLPPEVQKYLAPYLSQNTPTGLGGLGSTGTPVLNTGLGGADQQSTPTDLTGTPISADSLAPGGNSLDAARRASTTGLNLPGLGMPDSTTGANGGTLSNILGSIFGGSGNVPNLSQILQSVIPIGSALAQYLGTDKAFNQAGGLINSAELNAGNQVNSTAQGAASGLNDATGNANDILSQLLSGTTGRNAPYGTAGADAVSQLQSGLQPGGSLNSNLTADQVLQNDPGYQFRLGQGLQGVQSKLAAEGLGDSGAAGKELEQYGQDYASNEFNNAWQRQQTSQQNLFNRLSGTAGIGQQANAQDLVGAESLGAPQASNLTNAAENSGLFKVQGSQYQGNAGVTGAGAQAGALIDANQQKNAMIQQIMTSLLSLFNRNNGSAGGNGSPGSATTDQNGNTTVTLPGFGQVPIRNTNGYPGLALA